MVKPGDIILVKGGTLWLLFSPIIRLVTWRWWAKEPFPEAFHVELGWESTADGYKALSMQPPLLTIVTRKFADVNVTMYRLKDRPENMDTMFWAWANPQIGKELYILGYNTCGMPIRDFYKEKFGLEMSPYPGPIEEYLKKSDKFEQVPIP